MEASVGQSTDGFGLKWNYRAGIEKSNHDMYLLRPWRYLLTEASGPSAHSPGFMHSDPERSMRSRGKFFMIIYQHLLSLAMLSEVKVNSFGQCSTVWSSFLTRVFFFNHSKPLMSPALAKSHSWTQILNISCANDQIPSQGRWLITRNPSCNNH